MMKPSSSPPPPQADPTNRPPWTIQSILSWTTHFFEKHGIPSARLDAEILLAHALGDDRLSLYLNYQKEVPETSLSAYRQFIQRRVRREPLAYIRGIREFFSVPLRVSPAVMIPRPETEHVVEQALEHVRKPNNPAERGFPRILDLGTGSGNIAIALATHLPGAEIVALDLSFSALAVAKDNARIAGGPCERITFVQSDLFGGLSPKKVKFHLVVSNPPYVPTEHIEHLGPEVRDFEPWGALDGGPGGTDVLQKILEQAPAYLFQQGVLICEIGEGQSEKVLLLARESGSYQKFQIYPDYSGIPRVLVAQTHS
jgi:release factor glutamine methyltransferase